MRSPYNFIVSPYGEKYKNFKTVDGLQFTVNTSLESSKHVNRFGKIKELPINYHGDVEVGDIVVLHHNVFRTYYDMKGRQTQSPEYFRDGEYVVSPERIYLKRKDEEGSEWSSNLNYCFVKPMENQQGKLLYNTDKEEKHSGELVYGCPTLIALGFKSGDMVGFKKNSEYAFEIDDEKLYRMTDNDIVIKLN